jgi:hypothetical protein
LFQIFDQEVDVMYALQHRATVASVRIQGVTHFSKLQ